MHPTRLLYPTLVALGLMASACGTDPVKGAIPKFPFFPTADAGHDADVEGVTCTGGKEVGDSEERTRYAAATVPAGETCKEEKQTRLCEEDGTWSDWSGTSKIFTCEVEGG